MVDAVEVIRLIEIMVDSQRSLILAGPSRNRGRIGTDAAICGIDWRGHADLGKVQVNQFARNGIQQPIRYLDEAQRSINRYGVGCQLGRTQSGVPHEWFC